MPKSAPTPHHLSHRRPSIETSDIKSDAKSDVNERIIEATIALITEGEGDVEAVTTRAIADKAQVTNSLINYHFQSKERLITVCVQRIIGKVIAEFSPQSPTQAGGMERVISVATETFEFLFMNPAISRISILGDMHRPSTASNTAISQHGIEADMGTGFDEVERRLMSFTILAAMQSAFLGRQIGMEQCGFDLNRKDARRSFIRALVTMVMDGRAAALNDEERGGNGGERDSDAQTT